MKKNNFKLPLLILIIITLLSNTVLAYSLTDIETSIYKTEIEQLIESKIIDGYEDGTFRPEANITRAEFTKLLAVALKLEESPEDAIHFDDVKGKWHEGYVGAIYKEGLMNGTSESTFTPDSNITREELAVVLSNSFKLIVGTENCNLETDFIDQDQISSWAKDAVVLANYIGLLEGIKSEEGLFFQPKSLGDRQLVAKLVYELLFNKESYESKIKEIVPFKEVIEEDSKNQGSSNRPTPTNPDEDKFNDIVSKYDKELRLLQSSIESELDSLVSQAVSEVNAGGSLSTVYKKYEKLARDLEANTDDAVSSIISKMEKDLKENGFDTGSADELYEEYLRIKEETEISISL